jgi:hypothetical protein
MSLADNPIYQDRSCGIMFLGWKMGTEVKGEI